MGQNPKRHCWECRRRCLVCDSTRPACNRCTAAGAPCPGYGDVKPTRLVWLAPGTVKSRVRKRKPSLPPEPNEPHIHGQSLVPATQLRQRATVVPRPHANDISIPRFGIYTDADAVVHSAKYFNDCIYPDISPLQALGNNPGIYQISPELIREATARPDYMRLSMLCMALSHRMNRTRGDPWANHPDLAERFYKYRGSALRSLRESLDVESHCTSDPVIAGIVSLLLADAQQASSLNWRAHVEGALKLVELRGGFAAVAASKTLGPHLRFLYYVSIIGNTTCPASDLSMAREHLGALDAILELSNPVLMPFQMCPPLLFAAIIKINHLRLQAAAHTHQATGTDMEKLTQEAYTILTQIQAFSPDQWARTKPRSRQDWTLIGTIYQASVALYCVSSLQSLSVLPTPLPPPLPEQRAAHASLLHQLLTQAVTSPRLKSFTLWPLVVLGVEAAHRGRRGGMVRDFVAARLPVLSREVGTCVPLTAKGVLERFWALGDGEGQGGWDRCFGRGYAFVTQLAVDSSRILAG